MTFFSHRVSLLIRERCSKVGSISEHGGRGCRKTAKEIGIRASGKQDWMRLYSGSIVSRLLADGADFPVDNYNDFYPVYRTCLLS